MEPPVGVAQRKATALGVLAQKVLLPGASVLEPFVARLRERVDARLCRLLGRQLTSIQQAQLEALLQVPPGARYWGAVKERSFTYDGGDAPSKK